MVEPILFVLIGVLASSIATLFIGHAVWQRAVRLTTQRVLRKAPVSRAEIVAAGDLIHAGHAVQLVRVERKLQATAAKASEYLAEIGRKIVSTTELNTELAETRILSGNRQARVDVLVSNLDHMQNALAKTTGALTKTRDQLNATNTTLVTLEQRYSIVHAHAQKQQEHMKALENTLREVKQQMAIAHKETQAASAVLARETAARQTAEKDLVIAKAKMQEETSGRIGELEAQLERLKVEKAMLEGVVSSVRARKRKAVAAARAETAALFESLPEVQENDIHERPELPNMRDVHVLTNRLAARQSKKMMATAANDSPMAGVAQKS